MKQLIALLFMLFIVSCEREDPQRELVGTIYLGSTPTNGAWYLYLDQDSDPANGYVAGITNSFAAGQSVAVYLIDAASVPDGQYFLYAGLDFNGTNSLDATNTGVWERIGWYGSSTNTAPPSPNVTIPGTANITLHTAP